MKRIVCFLMGMMVLGSTIFPKAPEPESIFAKGAVLMDGESGRILYEKQGNLPLPMASTTKIMTCILALELGTPEETVVFSFNAAKQPNVQLSAKEGEQFYLKDLLFSLMLASHNDTAVAIAEEISGSVENFAREMNEKAKEIGCENTHYITPNGLDGEDRGGTHHTTARDLALVMRYCIKESHKAKEFLEITGTDHYSFASLEGKEYQVQGHNSFLTMMEGACSGKTGYTGKAGYCYVGALKQGNTCLIVALLASGWPNHKDYKWKDTCVLMEYGLKETTYLSEEEWKVKEGPVFIPVKDGIASKVLGKAEEKSTGGVLLLPGETFSPRYELLPFVNAPVKKGDTLGILRYEIGSTTWKIRKVSALEEVKKINFEYCLSVLYLKFLLQSNEGQG